MGAGFGGGMGHSGCVWGALTASIMVLEILQGRTNKDQNREPAYRASEEFHSKFCETFGGTCCRILNPHPFETKEHLRHCLKITGNTASLMMSYIAEYGLRKTLTTQESAQVNDFLYYQYVRHCSKLQG